MLSLSRYAQFIPSEDGCVVYHSLFGQPQILDRKVSDFVKSFQQGRNGPFTIDEQEILSNLQTLYLVNDDKIDERKVLEATLRKHEQFITSGAAVSFLSLIMAETCNFNCSYCIAEAMKTERSGHKTKPLMSKRIAFSAVDSFAKLVTQNTHEKVQLNFGGGEPLLNFPLIRRVVNYCREVHPHVPFHFTMNTNASLITPEIAEFITTNKIEIATSLDGLPEWNDRVRMTKGGKGTHHRIMSGFNNLSAAGAPAKGFAVTVTPENFPGLDEKLIDFVTESGYDDVSIDLDVVHLYREITAEEAATRLIYLSRYERKIGVRVTGFWERPAENMFISPFEKHVGFCGGKKGYSMCVSSQVDILICGYSATKVGNVLNKQDYLPNDRYSEVITSRLIGRNKRCIDCSIEGQCIGGCFITEEFASNDKSSALEFNCQLFRILTTELLKDQSAVS